MVSRVWTLLLAGSILFGVSGCDDAKKYPSVVYPAHCKNGIQDNGEYDVDCGGECPACTSVIAATCQIDTNKVYYSNPLVIPFSGNTETIVMGRVTYDSYGGQASASGFTTSGSFDLCMAGDLPTASRIYTLGGTSFQNGFYPPGTVMIRITDNQGGAAISASGKVFANLLPNGKVLFSFCDAKFVFEQNTSMVIYNSIKGRMICSH